MSALLKALIEYQKSNNISDIHFVENEVPLARNHNGQISPLNEDPISSEMINEFVNEICSEEEIKTFHVYKSLDLARDLYNQGRFRINLFKERRGTGINIRIIPDFISNIEALEIPFIVRDQIKNKEGLIFISGPNNAGKTTLLNAFINILNEEEHLNIITLEDPIEYVHIRKNSLISQREITYEDKESLRNDLKAVFRQDADVVCIGEIRDSDTMETALDMCETGYLVIATIHASSVLQTFLRIKNLYRNHDQLNDQLSDQLRMILCQYLVPGINNNLVPCREIFINDDAMKSIIKSGDFNSIKNQIEISRGSGNILFDQYLLGLYEKNAISFATVKKYLNNKNLVYGNE